MKMHVGRGASAGALTVFPLWTERGRRAPYSTDLRKVSLSERIGAPAVNSLTASNSGQRPRLMLEGMLLEGGWQNRMLLRSVLVPGGQQLDLPVACVEEGRWEGSTGHTVRARRASVRIRGANRPRASLGEDVQDVVWSRVREYDGRFGADATTSFVGHVERAQEQVRRLVAGVPRLPGQSGVLIAISGHPVMLELFDSPTVFSRHRFSILQAAAIDALGRPAERTPVRRAWRFVDRVSEVHRVPQATVGLGRNVVGADDGATVSALEWQDRHVHVAATNPRHELIGAA